MSLDQENTEPKASQNYQELGILPDIGKHSHIAQLDRMGFNVPPTIALGTNLKEDDKEVFAQWIEEHKELDLTIRTDSNNNAGRYSFSDRDAQDPELLWEKINNIKDVKSVIIQGYIPNAINLDIVSADIWVHKNHNLLTPSTIVADIAPDIAPLLEKVCLTPFWQLTLRNSQTEITNNSSEKSKQLYWEYIAYRIGRDYAKKLNSKVKYPNVEQIDNNSDTFHNLNNLGNQAIHLKPEEYLAATYWNEQNGTKNPTLTKEIEEIMRKEMAKIQRATHELPYYNPIFKMSVIMDKKKLVPTYWDIITIPNDIIRYES